MCICLCSNCIILYQTSCCVSYSFNTIHDFVITQQIWCSCSLRGPQRLTKLLKDTQLVSGRDGNLTQDCISLELTIHSVPYVMLPLWRCENCNDRNLCKEVSQYRGSTGYCKRAVVVRDIFSMITQGLIVLLERKTACA